MVNFFRSILLISILKLSLQTEVQISYDASSTIYNPLPNELELVNVAVFTRHGDRAQITRALSPLHPENSNITSFWRSKMPIEKSFRIMAGSAAPVILSAKMTVDDLISNLYSGLDHSHSPYAQLTQIGSLQLMAVGRELRRRYVGSLLPQSVDEASDLMFCRSSNICRTVQSLRSLLAGMFNSATGTNSDTEMTQDHKLPYIFTRHKSSETLFPHADGPCTHMTDRRVKLYHHYLNATSILRWGSLERRMIDFMGTSHKRIGWLTWLNILDIYTCFQAHNIPFPAGLTKSDLESITELVGWTWDVLYADNMLSRLAIGRFIREAVDNMDTAVNYTTRSTQTSLSRSSSSGRREARAMSENRENETASDSTDDIETKGKSSSNNMTNITKASSEGTVMETVNRMNLMVDPSGAEGVKSTSTRRVNSGTKMLIYSGHDSTMVPLLKAIGLYNGDWPPYASYLTLEVARLISEGPAVPQGVVGGLYVRAVYNDKDRVMTGCDDQLWCSYDMFHTQILKTGLTHAEYQKECRNSIVSS